MLFARKPHSRYAASAILPALYLTVGFKSIPNAKTVQESSASSPATQSPPTDGQAETPDKKAEPAEEIPTDLIAAVITSIVGPIVVYYLTDRRASQRVAEVRNGITAPQPASLGGRRSSVMVFGIGGVGKTSLIDNMFGGTAPKTERTENVWFYEYSDQVAPPRLDGARSPKSQSFTHYISDYKGQNLGTIVQSFIVQQKRTYSPMAYGHVTSAIFVVDLFETDDDGRPIECADASRPSQARVTANLDAWNGQALDAIFGMLVSDNLRCVVLFINKVNALNPNTPQARAAAHAAYDPLKSALALRVGKKVKLCTILGSAGNILGDNGREGAGAGLVQLEAYIRDAADPVMEGPE
jgi:hypothetical protein